MEQRSNYAAAMDAQIKFRMEGCVSGMGQRSMSNDVAVKGAQVKLRKEECA